jgi:heat shock protein HslJ
MVFGDDTVTGTTGCNRYHGPYTYDSDHGTLMVGALAMTQMAGPPEVMATERRMMTVLSTRLAVELDDELDRIIISGTEGFLILVRLAPTDLIGTWEVTSLHWPERQAIISTHGRLVAAIDTERITGTGGCNSFNGRIELGHDSMRIGPVMSTMKFCNGDGVMEQEQAFFRALESTTSYRLDGRNRLDLLRADGGIAVSLHRSAPTIA